MSLIVRCDKCDKPTGAIIDTPVEWVEGENDCPNCGKNGTITFRRNSWNWGLEHPKYKYPLKRMK